MNAYTTIEESKQLIEAGLDVNTQDMYYQQCCSMLTGEYKWKPFIGEHLAIRENLFSYRNGYTMPCWSLAALLNIIDNNNIVYDICNDKNRDFKILVYDAEYIKQTLKFYHTENNITDMIIWLLEHNYIKSNKNE